MRKDTCITRCTLGIGPKATTDMDLVPGHRQQVLKKLILWKGSRQVLYGTTTSGGGRGPRRFPPSFWKVLYPPTVFDVVYVPECSLGKSLFRRTCEHTPVSHFEILDLRSHVHMYMYLYMDVNTHNYTGRHIISL